MKNNEEYFLNKKFGNKKFLFVSYDALITDLAWQVKKEGHEVKYFIKNAVDKEIGDGFVEKIDNWQKEIDWADVIIFDDVLGMGKWADELRKKGKLVVGGSPYTDMLEDDRSFGQEELKKAGVPIIPYQDFNSFDEAIKYVKNSPGQYVIKPCGEAQNVKRFLFVGQDEDGKDILEVLRVYSKMWSGIIKTFQLQKLVKGVEIAVGAFFNGKEFVYPININFENKKLFPGNIGPSTGEMGTSMFWSMTNKIFNSTLLKLEGILRHEKYIGYIDLNCIVNGKGIFPLEFTTRFGYPTIHIQQEGILMPMGEFLFKLANGTLKGFNVRKGFQIGIRLVVPPFPYGSDAKNLVASSKNSVILFKKPMLDGIHIEEVKKSNGNWLVTGSSGVVLVVTGTGDTMRSAIDKAYKKINNILIPNMYYRDDIGERWFEDSDKLHNWGYLREL